MEANYAQVLANVVEHWNSMLSNVITVCNIYRTAITYYFWNLKMSTFNADDFLSATTSDSNSTKIIPCPIGEYPAIIDKVVPRQWQSKDGTQSGIAVDVFWLVQDAGAQQACGREQVSVKQGLMLDTNSNGGLDMSEGKNVPLGRLREAVGKNEPGQPFAFAMLPGLMAKISVNHRQDKNDPELMYAEVKLVTKL